MISIENKVYLILRVYIYTLVKLSTPKMTLFQLHTIFVIIFLICQVFVSFFVGHLKTWPRTGQIFPK